MDDKGEKKRLQANVSEALIVTSGLYNPFGDTKSIKQIEGMNVT